MRRSRPTVTIGRSALLMKFDRSSVSASSSRLRLRNCSLTVVSSSFDDCSSSLVVSSSSLVLCSSSLLESTSSCAARSSCAAASCSSTIDCRYCLVDASSCRSQAASRLACAELLSSWATAPADQAGQSFDSNSTSRQQSALCAHGHRQHAQRELDVVGAVPHAQLLAHDRRVGRLRFGQRAAQLHEQPFPGHPQDVRRRLPARALRGTATCARGTAAPRNRG